MPKHLIWRPLETPWCCNFFVIEYNFKATIDPIGYRSIVYDNRHVPNGPRRPFSTLFLNVSAHNCCIPRQPRPYCTFFLRCPRLEMWTYNCCWNCCEFRTCRLCIMLRRRRRPEGPTPQKFAHLLVDGWKRRGKLCSRTFAGPRHCPLRKIAEFIAAFLGEIWKIETVHPDTLSTRPAICYSKRPFCNGNFL